MPGQGWGNRSEQRPAVSVEFEHALAQEVLRSELIRVKALIATTALLAAIFLTAYFLAPDALNAIWRGGLKPNYLYVTLVPFLLFELWVHTAISRQLKLNRDLPVIRRYIGALIETTMPTVALALHIQGMGSVQALGFVVPLAYFIFIILSTLRLDFCSRPLPASWRRPNCSPWRCFITPPAIPIPTPKSGITPRAA
jgi:adenylate cyclase